jgi:dihydrodipicolinate synthase/N-acetylneuraminate lyase
MVRNGEEEGLKCIVQTGSSGEFAFLEQIEFIDAVTLLSRYYYYLLLL